MNDDTFWALIDELDWTEAGDDDAVVEPLIRALVSLEESDVYDFDEQLAQKLYDLDTVAIARATGDYTGPDDYLSPDGFLYSRCAIVANGRAVYEDVLADPSEWPGELRLWFTPILDVAKEAYARLTGEEPEEYDYTTEVSYETFSNRVGWMA